VSIQRKVTPEGKVRYRGRIKANGREVASRMFDRKSDAVAGEQDQLRRLRAGEWLDPRRGPVPLNVVAEMWLESRRTVKRRTLESDRGAWRNYIAPRFGRRPVRSLRQRGRRVVRRYVEEQAGSDCPTGAGGGAHRGSVVRRRGARVNGSSPRRRAVRCEKPTGSGRSAGVRRRRRLGGPSCAFMISATRRLRYGWHLALIRKWSSEYWGTPGLP
jgi:hypothetical protein